MNTIDIAAARCGARVRRSTGFDGALDVVCKSGMVRSTVFLALLRVSDVEHVADWENRTVGGGLEYVSSWREKGEETSE